MIAVRCAQCGKEFRVKDEMAGKRAKCPCGDSILIPAVQVTVAPAPPPPVAVTEAPAKRPVCGTLALIFGGAALGLGLLGCLLYLAFWLTLDVSDKFSVAAGLGSTPGAAKLLLPKLMNYLAVVGALAGLVLGTISLFLEDVKRSAKTGIILASSAVLILFAFWLWTVTRNPYSYTRDMFAILVLL